MSINLLEMSGYVSFHRLLIYICNFENKQNFVISNAFRVLQYAKNKLLTLVYAVCTTHLNRSKNA